MRNERRCEEIYHHDGNGERLSDTLRETLETLREIVVRCERSPQMAQHRYAVDVANDALKKAARAASGRLSSWDKLQAGLFADRGAPREE